MCGASCLFVYRFMSLSNSLHSMQYFKWILDLLPLVTSVSMFSPEMHSVCSCNIFATTAYLNFWCVSEEELQRKRYVSPISLHSSLHVQCVWRPFTDEQTSELSVTWRYDYVNFLRSNAASRRMPHWSCLLAFD